MCLWFLRGGGNLQSQIANLHQISPSLLYSFFQQPRANDEHTIQASMYYKLVILSMHVHMLHIRRNAKDVHTWSMPYATIYNGNIAISLQESPRYMKEEALSNTCNDVVRINLSKWSQMSHFFITYFLILRVKLISFSHSNSYSLLETPYLSTFLVDSKSYLGPLQTFYNHLSLPLDQLPILKVLRECSIIVSCCGPIWTSNILLFDANYMLSTQLESLL